VYIGDYYEPFQVRWRSAMRTNGVLTWLLGDHMPLQGASRGSTTVTANADGTLASGQTYTACPLRGCSARAQRSAERCPQTANTPSGCRPGQISEEQLGIYFYNARYYDPYLARFISPDSIIPQPGNPLAWDRYAYVRYNPVRYNDPSGNRECDETDTYGRCHYAPRIIMILACGDGLGANCEGDYSGYGGEKPLSDFEKSAKRNGYEAVFFGADAYKNDKGENSIELYANALSDYMLSQGEDAHFIIIGHSRGARAAIWATSTIADQQPLKIKGTILLDATLTSDPARSDTQLSIDSSIAEGIQISSYVSWQYRLSGDPLPNGFQTSFLSVTHLSLATDELFWITWENTVQFSAEAASWNLLP
jgi:RHS repeat-associated protein